MKKILVVGCSFAKGTGLENEEKNPKLWVNQLHQQYWSDHQLSNFSSCGKNNEWIFFETMSALIKNHYDLVLVEWTVIPRFNINIGLELYPTITMLNSNSIDISINNNELVSSEWLSDLGNRLRRYHNDHWDLLNLVRYINVLIEIQKTRNHKILFVNGICPWPKNYFVKADFNSPNDLTEFEKNILNFKTRDDEEIYRLYNMIHDQYEYYGGIHENLWLNLYDSLYDLQIDDASNIDRHPGLASQEVYVEKLKQRII